MNRKSIILLISIVLSLGVHSAAAESLTIPGTGACTDLLNKLAQAYMERHPEVTVHIPPSVGSGGGIKAVLRNEAVMARVARPLDTAKGTEAGLEYRPFARGSVVFAIGAKAGPDLLTAIQLKDIFSGKIETWDAVGGPARPIRVLIRQKGDSSYTAIDNHLPGFGALRFTPNAKIVYHDFEMIALLKKYRYAIGWVPANAMTADDRSVQVLSIDGIAPTSENIRSGRYRAAGEYALIYKNSRLTKTAEAFLDFVFSTPAQQIMRAESAIAIQQP